jgi:hypothetical protein
MVVQQGRTINLQEGLPLDRPLSQHVHLEEVLRRGYRMKRRNHSVRIDHFSLNITTQFSPSKSDCQNQLTHISVADYPGKGPRQDTESMPGHLSSRRPQKYPDRIEKAESKGTLPFVDRAPDAVHLRVSILILMKPSLQEMP